MRFAIMPTTRLIAATLLPVVAVVGTIAGTTSTAEEPPAKLPPSRITKENYDRIAARKGTITEGDVVAILGPPTLFRRDGSSNRDFNIVWEHRTFIEIQLKNDRVRNITGAFSPYVTSKVATPDNLKKLSTGMSEDDVRKILGAPGAADCVLRPSFTGDGHILGWGDVRLISLDFKNGKVTNMAMFTPSAD
jgi:hypothetical protein